ncbi:MAG: glycogen/starch/alpha-glucan phosphorylase [Oscillospiraceae bacterium]|nr:glycogen/starch/alpha-glucan phosphorylase [Oscillospiraceae bacterium]
MQKRKEKIKMNLNEVLNAKYNKNIQDCSDREIYFALLEEVKKEAEKKADDSKKGKKKLYYISAEFLIGKLLSNNLINLGLYDDVKKQLKDAGRDICTIEDAEPEPSLGNGGLGRLAACFLDSIATLGLNGDGVGIKYHYGLFRQKFEDNQQTETPDVWLEDESWLTKTDKTYKIDFKNVSVNARLYDIDVTGYCNNTNKLHLFDVETVDETIVESGIDFDKNEIAKNLTLFLYPDDSDEAGRLLRIYQEYFMVSCGARLILDECIAKGSNLYDLADYAAIQINDTHPTMVIPELIRLLVERGIDIDDAIEIVTNVCAYTNHTILAEALEKWSIDYLKKVVPQLIPIIEILDDKVRRKFDNEKVAIIDRSDTVHMAHIDIHYSHSVNGVAKLHTDILKENELHHFYEIYPEKFNNKTNGITFRRWLMHCNPELAEYITSLIGDGWKKNADELENLKKYVDDEKVLAKILEIKDEKKKELASFLKKTQNIDIDANTIFDIQIKRLHEYKRQQMNALYIIHKYLEIKSGKKPETPVTIIFGAKAAPAYIIAQDIIHLILCLQELINNDPEVNKYLRVIMVENYNVTNAEHLIPACDISEQISLASKEASGTGNMKFMLNGAVTLGTEDGANVEIHSLVGDENIYIFGDSSETVVKRYADGSYKAKDYYEKSEAIKEAVDFITGEELLEIGNKERLERLSHELISKDWFMTFPDFEEYVETKEKAYSDYNNRTEWAKKMLINISCAGYFSSDRTIAEYNKDIWHLN